MYDQGQVSTSLYYQNDDSGIPITRPSGEDGKPDFIRREQSYTDDILQLDEISNSHPPKRRLTMSDALPFGIKRHRIEEPFRFTHRLLQGVMDTAKESFFANEPINELGRASNLTFRYYYFTDQRGTTLQTTAPATATEPMYIQIFNVLGHFQSYSNSTPPLSTMLKDSASIKFIIQAIFQMYQTHINMENTAYGLTDDENGRMWVEEMFKNIPNFNYPEMNAQSIDNMFDRLFRWLKDVKKLTRTSAYFIYLLIPRYQSINQVSVNLAQIAACVGLLYPWLDKPRPKRNVLPALEQPPPPPRPQEPVKVEGDQPKPEEGEEKNPIFIKGEYDDARPSTPAPTTTPPGDVPAYDDDEQPAQPTKPSLPTASTGTPSLAVAQPKEGLFVDESKKEEDTIDNSGRKVTSPTTEKPNDAVETNGTITSEDRGTLAKYEKADLDAKTVEDLIKIAKDFGIPEPRITRGTKEALIKQILELVGKKSINLHN